MAPHVLRLPFSLDPLIAEAKRRARRRRALLAAVLLLAAAGTALGVVATYSPTDTTTSGLAAQWQGTRACPRQGGGALTPNLRWEDRVVSVTISRATASGIAQQIGPNEFQPAGTHPAVSAVPCNVASMAANVAAAAWSAHPLRQNYTIGAGWTGENAGPTYRFVCVMQRVSADVLTGTCTHTPNSRAGAVKVRLLVHRFHRPA
jgi:hypothetical protein